MSMENGSHGVIKSYLDHLLDGARKKLIDAPRLCMMLEGCDAPSLPYLAVMCDHPLMLGTLLEYMLSAALEGLIDRPSLVGLLLSTFGSREKPSLRKALDEGSPVAIDIYLQFALAARQKGAIHSDDLMTLFRGLSPDVKKAPLLWRAMANDKKEVVKAWLNHLTTATRENLLDSSQLVSLLGFRDSSMPENESSYEIALAYQHLDLARYFKERMGELQKDGYPSEDDVSVILQISGILTKRPVKEHGSDT
jgi:hypothetical protein